LFNLFPGMGAWDLSIRRAGLTVAKEMILSGRLYSAEELLARSMIDVVVPDGSGEMALEREVRHVDPRLRGTLAALRARQIAAPISQEKLLAIVELWADTALRLTDRDDGPAGARPGPQGRRCRARGGRGDQAHGAGHRLGRVQHRHHRLGEAVAGGSADRALSRFAVELLSRSGVGHETPRASPV